MSSNKPPKPSDFSKFVIAVYDASSTMMDLDEYFEMYEELLRLMFWNQEVDGDLYAASNPSGVSTKTSFLA